MNSNLQGAIKIPDNKPCNPGLTSASNRVAEEHEFKTHDNENLFYRYWPSVSDKPRGAILLFHRGHEHSGRLAHLVEELAMNEYAFFAWDARGHGHSPGERGFSPDMATSIRDIQTFVEHISQNYGFAQQDMAVIAQSVGAVTAAAWVHDYAPKIRCMILASPAFKVKLYIPFARTALKIRQVLQGNFFINSYVKAKFLTHDQERIESYHHDPLVTRAISSNILLGLYDTAERIVADAAAITIPTQLLISGSDWVVEHKPQHQFYENLGSSRKERIVLDGFFHDTLGEKQRHIAIDKVRTFLRDSFVSSLARPMAAECHKYTLRHADQQGFTRQEADKLASPLSAFSFKGLYWSLTGKMLQLGGLLSEGIRLGHKTGFDSGSTLDYVYRNKPRGFTRMGRLVDKHYLNSVGWRGIRRRKQNLEELIKLAADELYKQGKTISIMDIAAGHGRYVLDAVEAMEHEVSSLLLRDYSELNVEQGTHLIKARKMHHVARFMQADAFDKDSYEQHKQSVTLAIVSGLYELFPDNERLRTSLQGLAVSVQEGGYLVYTNQPWHPQLELIARCLTSHRGGEAWLMRRRTQQEMDQLVADAGFTKIAQRIDEYGIFTVSLAIKNRG